MKTFYDDLIGPLDNDLRALPEVVYRMNPSLYSDVLGDIYLVRSISTNTVGLISFSGYFNRVDEFDILLKLILVRVYDPVDDSSGYVIPYKDYHQFKNAYEILEVVRDGEYISYVVRNSM